MKYVALLRGINVGGNNIVKMSALKTLFEECDLTQVMTYINSGNVMFQTDEQDRKQLTKKLEHLVLTRCKVDARILLKSQAEMKDIISQAPKAWKTSNDLRCYIAFLFDSLTVEAAEKEISLRDNVDSLTIGPQVLYMTTVMSEITKSKFNKLAGQKIYKEMTIRNFNTTNKILTLMEQ